MAHKSLKLKKKEKPSTSLIAIFRKKSLEWLGYFGFRLRAGRSSLDGPFLGNGDFNRRVFCQAGFCRLSMRLGIAQSS
jgi:hypothetical protein